MNLTELKYPIGKFKMPEVITPVLLQDYILIINAFPEKLQSAVINLTTQQLDTPYREGGWTVRQLVHHCADSHMNSLMRFKLALTEDAPKIKPYLEASWAELPDSKSMPLEPALKMLEGIHERWVFLLNHLSADDFAKTFVHPEHGRVFRLDESTALYAWHCQHHLAHITSLKSRMNWH